MIRPYCDRCGGRFIGYTQSCPARAWVSTSHNVVAGRAWFARVRACVAWRRRPHRRVFGADAGRAALKVC